MFERKKNYIFYKKENKIKRALAYLDIVWIFSIAFIWLKSLLFLALLHGKDSATINISKMYFSPPPVVSHILFIVAFFSFAFLFKNSGRKIFYIVLNLLISTLIWVDLLYFRAYGAFLSSSFIVNPGTFNPLRKNLLGYFHGIDILFFIDILIFILIMVIIRNNVINKNRSVLAFAISLAISIGYISFDHYWIDVKDATKGTMMFFRVCWAPFQTMSNMSPIGYHVYDTYLTFTSNKNMKLTSSEKEKVDNWFKDNAENIEDNDLKGVFKNKNLIFLQVESLEQFVINEKVNGQEITPNINKMLANSLSFSNIYEQVNSGTSSDGDLLSNTSIFPVRDGSTFFKYPNTSYNSLPQLLNNLGYNTISTHPEKGGNWNWIHAHKAIGFNKSWDVSKYKLDELIGPGLSDGSLFKQVTEFLSEEKKPFYAHVVTLTSHGPFEVPEKEKNLKLDEALDKSILGAYFQSVNYVDRQIGNFIEDLRKRDMLKDTVIVIYGDHTGVHKFYEDKLKDLKVENPKWLEKDLRVPLIIYNEGLQGKNSDTIGGQIDIMPTVAYLMGVEEKAFVNSSMGKILVKTNKNYTILNYGEIIGSPDEKEINHIKESFSIADYIIKGNYFKK